MNGIKPVAIGLISGSIAVLVIWLTRVVLPPRPASLPDIIRLDSLNAYSARPSVDPALLEEAQILERVVDRFEVSEVTPEVAVKRLAEIAKVNVVLDREFWTTTHEQYFTKTLVSISTQSATVDRILERIFLDAPPDSFEQPRWVVRNGIILIAVGHRYDDALIVVRAYDVRDLMLKSRQVSSSFPTTTRPSSNKWDAILHGSEQEAAERLIVALRGGEPEWESPLRDIHYFGGKLLVRAMRPAHRLVEERLTLLRKDD